MAGRASAFADPEILQLAKTAFVPASADDWYQRRRADAEGRFWKTIWSQGPRGADAPTHQGIYVFTADGELLSFKNAGQDAGATKRQLRDALAKWAALPAGRRRPGAAAVPDHGPLDSRYSRRPPEGGAVVRIHARILDRDGERYQIARCDFVGGDKASRDFLWFTADDVAALAAIPPNVGHAQRAPRAMTERLIRFHLVDNTRGEPDFWTREQILFDDVRLEVVRVDKTTTDVVVNGRVELRTDSIPVRSYDARLFGHIRATRSGQLERFDLVAIGEHRGAGAFTKLGERSGFLGITFELADPAFPANRIPPQGVRDPAAYFGVA